MVEDTKTEDAIERALAKRPTLCRVAVHVRCPTSVASRAVAEVAPIEIGAHGDRVGAEMAEQGPDAARDVEDVCIGGHADPVAKEYVPATPDSEHGLISWPDARRGYRSVVLERR